MRRTRFSWFLLLASLFLAGAGCISVGGSANTTNTGGLGIFVSADKGEKWQPLSSLPTVEGVKQLTDVAVYRLILDPTDQKSMYWLSRDHGLFYSYDEGRTWQKSIGEQFRSGFVYGVAIHPKEACTIYATNGVQLFKSTDCTRSWVEVYRESRGETKIIGVTVNPFPPYQIHIAESAGEVLKSSDGGKSWSVVIRLQVPLVHMITNPLDENTMYIISRRNGLYRSADGGATWIALRDTMKDFSGALEYRRIVLHPKKPNVLYWISTFGILVSEDRGDSWHDMKLITPPGSAQIYAFAVSAQNDKEIYYTATIGDRSTLYKSEDGGTKWITRKVPSGALPTMLAVHSEKGNVLYMGFSPQPKK
ncbi:MAG: hypothetical protein HY984_01150 [Candidatus Magasanikbacteria bacterium]|nr:hypothetical protein [Candidatus Magasanikbacteria bacterium]